MLRIIENASAAGAKSYYSAADYYTEGQELEGRWHGDAAKRLGLSGKVNRVAWDALCDNRDPNTGQTLTPRQKANRRIGYDFNFHVPKSVSVLYGLTQDDRILEAFRQSVNATMQDMEAEMKTRVRGGGKNEDRTTGNMVWGEFVHTTARPVDGIPDPHLHAHCFVFNTTWDKKEGRWKAGQFADLKRDAPYFEAVFHSRLARGMEELGLSVERTRKGWELAGTPKSVIEKFSRRTAQIEETAKQMGIVDPAAKDELGAKTRESKRKDLTSDELRAEWNGRLTEDERNGLEAVKDNIGSPGIAENDRIAREAVELAIDHCLERSSVVPERKILTEALKRSYGAASVENVHRNLAHENLIIGMLGGRRMATTREVLAEERRMIGFAREGRGACRPLGDALYAVKRDWLNDGQRRAVRHLLTSNDRVMLVRGAAGTGKTSMAQEAVEAIEASGRHVFMFAPSADASRGVLRDDGFAHADTVARLLLDERMQSKIGGQVIWIDEAGLLGSRQMTEVFDLAERLHARVILSGDRKQHGSVERGAALRLLETEAGLVPAEIRDIKRQQGAYRQAVEALSEARTEDGFRQLDELGWIKEVPTLDRYKTLASDYVNAITDGKSTALVVSPTHLEGEWVTDQIRAQLKESGKLKGRERRVMVLENTNLTEAQRADATNYDADSVLVFHQNAKGYQKGQRVKVSTGPLPLSDAAKFQVFRPNVLPIAPGDVIRITRNGKTVDGRHTLNNGQIFPVKTFDANGDIVLANGWTVAQDYGHLTHGYCITSHAAQGKTVDHVFIGQSSQSFPASSREQFYVSASRGRKSVTVYTDQKEALLDAVSRYDDRLSATELVTGRELRERGATLQRLERLKPTPSRHDGREHREREAVYER